VPRPGLSMSAGHGSRIWKLNAGGSGNYGWSGDGNYPCVCMEGYGRSRRGPQLGGGLLRGSKDLDETEKK